MLKIRKSEILSEAKEDRTIKINLGCVRKESDLVLRSYQERVLPVNYAR